MEYAVSYLLQQGIMVVQVEGVEEEIPKSGQVDTTAGSGNTPPVTPPQGNPGGPAGLDKGQLQVSGQVVVVELELLGATGSVPRWTTGGWSRWCWCTSHLLTGTSTARVVAAVVLLVVGTLVESWYGRNWWRR